MIVRNKGRYRGPGYRWVFTKLYKKNGKWKEYRCYLKEES